MDYKSIILSGLPGSGKTTLAKQLSEIYSWPIHSIGQLWRDEWKRHHPDGEVSFADYWRGTTLEDNLNMNKKARKIFERGNVIGDTRYSLYCKDLPALLVLVTADLDVRSERALNTGRYEGKTVKEVKNVLAEREKDELKVGQDLYGVDYDYRDPEHYHLTINSGMLSVDEEVQIIANFVEGLIPLIESSLD